jgi:hypothetical protein
MATVIRLTTTEDVTPERLAELSTEVLAALVVEASAIVSQRLLGATHDEDRMISVEEAAALTGISASSIRRNKPPFVRQRTPHAAIRCSLAGCREWIAGQRKSPKR